MTTPDCTQQTATFLEQIQNLTADQWFWLAVIFVFCYWLDNS